MHAFDASITPCELIVKIYNNQRDKLRNFKLFEVRLQRFRSGDLAILRVQNEGGEIDRHKQAKKREKTLIYSLRREHTSSRKSKFAQHLTENIKFHGNFENFGLNFTYSSMNFRASGLKINTLRNFQKILRIFDKNLCDFTPFYYFFNDFQ